MNLLRSICCLFSSGCGEKAEPTGTRQRESSGPKADLGQTEAGLEKSGKEQMGHMEGDEAQNRPTRQP
jgi:hypothetical protein